MFSVGDLIVYPTHGICRVEDICEKTVSGKTKPYYVLHPIDSNHQLTITTPVHNDKVMMLHLIRKEEAHEILKSFKKQGVEWIDNLHTRHRTYTKIINTGDRQEIANVLICLMRKKAELGEKLHEQDWKLINTTRDLLFKELAITLSSSFEEINEYVSSLVKGS